ncbi:hypothetical protein B0H13DRAFT_1604014, partial [Mycena leptocephala]
LPRACPWPRRKIPTTEKNAYLQFSRRGNKPADIPQNTDIPWTQAVYPHPVITSDDLLDSLDPQQRAKIEANPCDFLAVVPICARKVFYQKNPSIHHDALKFILSLGFTYDGIDDVDDNTMDLSLPKRAGPANGNYAKPWAVILSDAHPTATEFLVWFQTFGVNTSLAFHVLPFDFSLQSCVIMNISGDAVKKSGKALSEALATIKKGCWADVAWVNHIENCLSQAGVPGSAREHAVLATKSFVLTLIDTDNSKGDPAPIWQLTGKPVSADRDQRVRWIPLTKGIPFLVGFNPLETGKRFVNCAWCKNATHPGHQCPLPCTDRMPCGKRKNGSGGI